MGFDPRQSDSKARVYTCWHSYLLLLPHNSIPTSNQQWPLYCYIYWNFGGSISLDGVPGSTGLFICFWKPHFFISVFRAQHSPCFPLNSGWLLSHICRLLLSCPKPHMVGRSRVPFFAPFLPYTLSQIFRYQLHSKNCQLFILIIRPKVYLLAWYLKTNISLT